MAASVSESFDSDLEEDIEENPEEVIEADEDSDLRLSLSPYLLGLDMLS